MLPTDCSGDKIPYTLLKINKRDYQSLIITGKYLSLCSASEMT